MMVGEITKASYSLQRLALNPAFQDCTLIYTGLHMINTYVKSLVVIQCYLLQLLEPFIPRGLGVGYGTYKAHYCITA